MPTRRPRRPSRSSRSKIDSQRTPSRGAKFERMPCSAGVAPVSMDEKHTTVTVQRVYNLEQTPEAIEQFSAGTLGKLVISID